MQIYSALYRWYEQNKRVLPWRETDDAYSIWISEIILQQTYHNKMLEAVSPCKVMKVIFAEDRFHRRMLKKWTRKDNEGK